MSIYSDIAQTLSILGMSPHQRAQLMQAEQYKAACMGLQALIGPEGMSVDDFREIVSGLAAQSTHSIFDIPGHLQRLLVNKWAVEALPKTLPMREALNYIAQHPVECEEQCLTKFLALLKGGKA
jgi:hypothetical protein